MKIRVYNVPIKNGSICHIPEDPIVLTKDITRLYSPEDPFAITKAMGRSYLHERRKDKNLHVDLITHKIEGGKENLKKILEEGFLDTLFKDEKIIKENFNRLNQWYIGAHLKHWFYRFFLGPILVLSSLGRIAEIAAGLELIFGRSLFVGRVENIYREFFQRISNGIESSYKNIGDVIQKEDTRLETLKKIIDACDDKIEGYKKAFHTCDELGLPQLKEFYLKCIPMGEWTIQEPNIYFSLKAPSRTINKARGKRKYRRINVQILRGELFEYDISAKEMQGIKTYSNLERLFKRAASKAGFYEIPIFKTKSGKTVWAYEIGSSTKEIIIIKAGTHGNEDASPRAVLQIMRSLGKEGKFTKEVLNKSKIIIIPCDDPEGFDIRNKMFVDMAGHEEHSPVQKGMVRYRDVNGVWGDHARSPRILEMQDYIRQIKPTFAIDLHETVIGEAKYWAKGAGILSIEDFYIPLKLRARFEKMGIIPENKFSKFISKIPFRRQLLAMEYARDLMRENPAFEQGEAMLQHVKDKGFRTFNMEYQKLMTPSIPIFPPQLLFFDEGRAIDGPLLYEGDIRVFTAWLHYEFGTTAYTSETFPNPMDERVLEDLAYVEGGVMKRLEIGKYARYR